MRAGSFVAAFAAFLALLLASAVLAALRGSDIGAVSDILFLRDRNAGLLAAALGWLWLIFGLFSVGAAFAAFAVLEGDDAPDRLPHRRMPKVAPVFLMAASLLALWFVFAPARPPASPPLVAAPATPIDVDTALAGAAAPAPEAPPAAAAPIAAAATSAAAAPPAPLSSADRAREATLAIETPLIWTYEYPLMRDGAPLASPEVERALAELLPMRDPDGNVARLLCGKAWVAFTGSASEEGPPQRNAMRARARAMLLARRAEIWLDEHPQCERPVILAMDLGQHAPTAAGSPADTAYQRQAIVVSRVRARPDERLDATEAKAELAAFYADPAMRGRLLGSRRFPADPAIFGQDGT
jgi:hypothetical protein